MYIYTHTYMYLQKLILMVQTAFLLGIQWNPFLEATLTRGPFDNVNLNINVLISTPDERPPLLKGHFSGAKGVASQERFHCTGIGVGVWQCSL